MIPEYGARLSRRTTLFWLAAAGLLPTLPVGALPSAPANKGYGRDPNLLAPVVPWPRIMTKRELQLTAVMADLILPGTDSAPPPSALGVPEFVDEWISAPYPDQMNDRGVILGGLSSLDNVSFVEADTRRREQLLCEKIDGLFIRRMRFLVVGGYYTTPEGFKDIGYVGNVPLQRFPPVTDAERGILETELRKLGITDPLE